MTFWQTVSRGVRPIVVAVISHGPLVVLLAAALVATGCDNSPYPESDEGQSVYYTSFKLEPKHLDPARGYSTWDGRLLGQCVEPPLQYHYLKRPYELAPLTAEAIPEAREAAVTFQGEKDQKPKTYPVRIYTVRITSGIMYQNHACFVRRNRHLTEADVRHVSSLADIKATATHELTAADYIHAVRRLADPRLDCPVYAKLARNMLGMGEYRKHLESRMKEERERRKAAAGALYNKEADEKYNPIPIDYSAGAEEFPFVRRVDEYTFELVLSRPYPQILYWMAMSFFAPVPPEAVEFYNQPVMLKRSIKLDENPVGTGPYKLVTYDPSNQIVFERNENYRLARYPDLPAPPESDDKAWKNYKKMKAAGMLDEYDASGKGTPLPMIDRIVYSMEKESIPRWKKFLQGYYDASGITSDLFDEAVTLTSEGDPNVSDEMRGRGIRLLTGWPMGVSYYAFNMTDETVGGYTKAKRQLRQAISIAINVEEYITVFQNDRGVPAHSPIPPGIFGNEEGPKGINEVVYTWDEELDHAVRRPLEDAKDLLKKVGYNNGYDANGRQLTIRYASRTASAEDRARLKFVHKQFQRLNIRLIFENTDHNQFQEKVREGNYQMLHWGWVADYPDPENFLFLLYGPNGKIATGGENVPNYKNDKYDRLFEQMENMTNGPERLEIIRKMLHILRQDAPWVFDFHGLNYALYHKWCHNAYPHALAYNTEKYVRLDTKSRRAYRGQHNQPVWWPLAALGFFVVVTAVPGVRAAARHFREV